MPPRADLVVVGGGVIGLSCAWRAAQRGLDVLLVERGAFGSGASRVAAGMLAPVAEADPGERALLELGVRSAALWPAFAEELGEQTGIDVGLRETGTLVVARDRDDAEALAREAGIRRTLGLDVETLLPSAARRLEPALAPGIRGALLAPTDHSADPRALVRALVAAARAAGARLVAHAECRVLQPMRAEPSTHAIIELADGRRVAAERVVLAAGAWSGGLADVPVRPVKGQTLRLRPRPGDAPLLTRTVRYAGGYLVPRADGRVVLGATTEERGFDDAITAGGVYELLRDAAEIVPGVLELEIEESVAGLRPGTPDNVPLLDEIAPGLVAATGHYRNGILLAPVSAELVVAQLDAVAA